MDEDKRASPEVVGIDDFEFDDEFGDLLDQLGDILSTEVEESSTVKENQINTQPPPPPSSIPNEPTNQSDVVESQVLVEVTKKTDITSLVKSVFDALLTMKQPQSVTENPVQIDETPVVKDAEMDCIPALDNDCVYQPDNVADDSYKLLKEKYRKYIKRRKKLKATSRKRKKSRGHKVSSDEYKRNKLMKQIHLLDIALERKRLEDAREMQTHNRSPEMKKKPLRRAENSQPSSRTKNGEFYEGHWANYVEPSAVITTFDLRNKLRLSAKRAFDTQLQSQYDLDHAENDESKRVKYDAADKKLNKSKTHRNYSSEEMKPSNDTGNSKLRSVCVTSSDDVLKRDKDLAKEDVEPVSSSTSVNKKANKMASRHSSTSSATTISVVHMDSTEGEIISSVDEIVPVKQHKKRKKRSISELKKIFKTENDAVKINAKDELKTTCVVLGEEKGNVMSPQTYEVFDIAPFESSKLDIEIISENIVSQTVNTTQCENTKHAMELSKNITPFIVLDSPGRDSIDSITSAKTIHRSRSVESITSNECEATETLDIIEKFPHPSSPGGEKSLANSDPKLSDISQSPWHSESSLSKLLLEKENLLELESIMPAQSVYSREDPKEDGSQSPYSTNGSLPSSSPSPVRKISQPLRRRKKLRSSQRRESSDETGPTSRDRKDVTRYREKWRDSPTMRTAYHSSNSPLRRRSRTPPRNIPHYRRRENVGASTSNSYYRKTSGSRSPRYKKGRSPYRNRSRSRSHERYKTLMPRHRKRSRSKSPYRRKPSRSPYRKRSTSPSRLRKSRSPYKPSLRPRPWYRRSYSKSPIRKNLRSKSPLQKRFEAAVADFLPQFKNMAAPTSSPKALMDGYAANSASFTMTATTVQQVYNSHGPPLQQNSPYSHPCPQQPLSCGPPMGQDYPSAAPPALYNYNLMWTLPQAPVHPPMLKMPYNAQMPLLPPGVAPYPNVEQPLMPPQNVTFPPPAPAPNQPPIMPTMPTQNISYPLPVPMSNQAPTILPPLSVLPPLVPAHQPTLAVVSSFTSSNVVPPDSGGQVIGATGEIETTSTTSQIASTKPSDKQLDLYSPSNSPPNSPVKYQSPFSSRALTANSPSIRTDMTGFMTESLTDGIPVPNNSTGSLYRQDSINSPIILRLKRNLGSLISFKSLEPGNNNQTPTAADTNSLVTLNQQVLDKLVPNNGGNSSKSLAIPVVGTGSKSNVIKKINFPMTENIPNILKSNKAFEFSESDELAFPNNNLASTCAVDKLDNSITLPIATLNRTSNNLASKNKNTKCISSNRIIIATTDFPCPTVNTSDEVWTNASNNSPSLIKSEVLEQVIKLLSNSKRTVCTQVSFVDDSLQGSDEVFEVKTGDHENLLKNLTRLLK